MEPEEQSMSEFELFKFRMEMVEEIIDHFLDKYYRGHITSFSISNGMVKCNTKHSWDMYTHECDKFEFPLEWAFVNSESDVWDDAPGAKPWEKKYVRLAADHMAIVRAKEKEEQDEKNRQQKEREKTDDLAKLNYLKEKYKDAI